MTDRAKDNVKICYNCFKEYDQPQILCPYCGYNHRESEEKYPYALKAGTVLNGQYMIGRVLGQGGFGITYLAMDNQLKVKVAIKEFLPEGMATRPIGASKVSVFSGDREENFRYGVERFLDEARVLAKFSGNPNIAAVKCYFSENDTAYFVMDYIEGISFKSYIRNKGGKIPYEDALRVLVPVLNALSAVHQEGFIHRDVTPDNIYITKNDEIKLLDFGSARYSLGDKSRSLDVVLKAGYAPKEQYVRRGKQGPYTDVYSVAACFYGAITGYLPPESLERMEEDSLVPPSTRGVKIPEYLEEAILKGLEVNSADRFQTAGEFLAALLPGESVTSETSATRPVTQQTPARQSDVQHTAKRVPSHKGVGSKKAVFAAGRKKWMMIASAAAVLVIAAVLIITASMFKKKDTSSDSDADKRLKAAMADFEENKALAVFDFISMLRSDKGSLREFMSTAISGDSDKMVAYIGDVSGKTFVGAGFTDLSGDSFSFASINNRVSAEVGTAGDQNYYRETIKEKSVVDRISLFHSDSMLVFSVPVRYENQLYSTAQLYYDLDSLQQGEAMKDPGCVAAVNQWLADVGEEMWLNYLDEEDQALSAAFAEKSDADSMTELVSQVDADKKLEIAADEAAKRAAEEAAEAAAREAAEKEAAEAAAREAAEKEAAEAAAREAAEKEAAEAAAREAAEKEAAEAAAREAAEREAAEAAAREAAEREAAEAAAAMPKQVTNMNYYLVTGLYSANVAYTGVWQNGKPEGDGVAVFLEAVPGRFDVGDTLTGTWVNGLIEGYGVYCSYDQVWQLHGFFINGLKEGMVKTYKNGEFVGETEYHHWSEAQSKNK